MSVYGRMGGYGEIESLVYQDDSLEHVLGLMEADDRMPEDRKIIAMHREAQVFAEAVVDFCKPTPISMIRPYVDGECSYPKELDGAVVNTKRVSSFFRVDENPNATSEFDAQIYARIIENKEEVFERRKPFPLAAGAIALKGAPVLSSGTMQMQMAVGDFPGTFISVGSPGEMRESTISIETINTENDIAVANLGHFITVIKEIAGIPDYKMKMCTASPLGSKS